MVCESRGVTRTKLYGSWWIGQIADQKRLLLEKERDEGVMGRREQEEWKVKKIYIHLHDRGLSVGDQS